MEGFIARAPTDKSGDEGVETLVLVRSGGSTGGLRSLANTRPTSGRRVSHQQTNGGAARPKTGLKMGRNGSRTNGQSREARLALGRLREYREDSGSRTFRGEKALGCRVQDPKKIYNQDRRDSNWRPPGLALSLLLVT
jgi:hypothetical protein